MKKKNKIIKIALETVMKLKNENINDDINRIIEYVSGSYFYPEKYGIVEDENVYKELIKELQDNYTYQLIWGQIKKEKYNIFSDKKYLAMLSFKIFLKTCYEGMNKNV